MYRCLCFSVIEIGVMYFGVRLNVLLMCMKFFWCISWVIEFELWLVIVFRLLWNWMRLVLLLVLFVLLVVREVMYDSEGVLVVLSWKIMMLLVVVLLVFVMSKVVWLGFD